MVRPFTEFVPTSIVRPVEEATEGLRIPRSRVSFDIDILAIGRTCAFITIPLIVPVADHGKFPSQVIGADSAPDPITVPVPMTDEAKTDAPLESEPISKSAVPANAMALFIFVCI